MHISEQELRRDAFELKFEGDFEGQLQRYDGGGAYVDETVDWTWHGFNAACDWMAARPVTGEEILYEDTFQQECDALELSTMQRLVIARIAATALNALKGQ